MAQPLIVASVGVEETPENRLKALAWASYFSGKFWELIRYQKLRPPTNPDGSITFSANLYKRLYNTCRIPGETKDSVQEYFKTSDEGSCPSHMIVVIAGRVFYFEFINPDDGHCITPQQFLYAYRLIRDTVENEPKEKGVPILTSDDRATWFHNRNHLKELSQDNAKYLEIIESAAMTASLDDSEPLDYSEVSCRTLNGDFHSRWSDKSSSLISFRNGKFGCVGEHSAYDGTISIAFSTFLLMSMMEESEPDWDEPAIPVIPKEVNFQLDDKLRIEIARMNQHVASIKNSVIVQCQQFDGYGKDFMKTQKVHPDAYCQMALQLAYYKLHKTLAPTYETGTMRVYYHGRTETVRSCSIEVKEWIDAMTNTKATAAQKSKFFKDAANAQFRLMADARKGKGFDRHLFGLWCMAYENDIPIPEFYDDPLYQKSGGGGNFVLSTSTLGFSINVGFVSPMVLDGYGVFYSMLDDCVWIIITSYRDSEVTSSKKFYEAFVDAMNEIKELLESANIPKL